MSITKSRISGKQGNGRITILPLESKFERGAMHSNAFSHYYLVDRFYNTPLNMNDYNTKIYVSLLVLLMHPMPSSQIHQESQASYHSEMRYDQHQGYN